MKIKICGIRSNEMMQACADAGVDYVGLNFVKSSKRFCSNVPEGRRVQRVGVFWNNPESEIQQKIEDYDLDIIQLYDADLVEKFQDKIPVWFALRVGGDDLEILKKIKPDLVLLDGSAPGSGQRVEEEKLKEAVNFVKNLGFEFGLAGGINVENIAEFRESFPAAKLLDTASGVEDEAGGFSKDQLSLITEAFQSG